MGELTTHILDLTTGKPAAGVLIEVSQSGTAALITRAVTGDNGRCAAPLLTGSPFHIGEFVLTIHLAEYFRQRGVALPHPPLLNRVLLHIGIAEPDQRYHVPLLITPWSYSVYRGG